MAGDGATAALSPVGTFTTGPGVSSFHVALGTASSPTFGLGTGLSPYLHVAPGAYAPPLVAIHGATPIGCGGTADYGGTSYCLDLAPAAAAALPCARAEVTYTLAGVHGSGVLVRAFPTADGVLPDGTGTLDGVLEADGPIDSGDVSIGCLASGLTYTIVIDALGDDAGPLAGEVVSVP